MRFYQCTGDDIYGNPCKCQYRELQPGQWEYRYVGDIMPWAVQDADWQPIEDRSVADLVRKGHAIVEVDDEPS